MFKQLRIEALKTTKTNSELLAQWKQVDRDRVIEQASGALAKEAVQKASLGLGLTGVLGVVGAAALPSTGSLSALLAGVGAATASGAVLPVVAVAALGAAVIGIAGLGIQAYMPVNYHRGVGAVNRMDRHLDVNASIDADGKDGSIGLKNWLQGAKNLAAKSVQEFADSVGFGVETGPLPMAVDPLDDIMGRYKAISKANGGLGDVQEPNKESGQYMGRVVVENSHFMIMAVGRNSIRFKQSELPRGMEAQAGKALSIVFKDGLAVERRQAAAIDGGVGR